MRNILLRVPISKPKKSKGKRKSVDLRGRISKDIWVGRKGKVFDSSKPFERVGVVYTDGKYTIEKVYVGKEDFYNIYKDGETLMAWRDTLNDAKRDLRDYKSGKLKMNVQGDDIKKLLSSKTDRWGLDIDKPIRPLIKELNEKGFDTSWSCSGHNDWGYVKFKKKYSAEEKKEVANILKNNGIKILGFGEDDTGHTEVTIEEVK